MKATEILDAIRKENPELVANIPNKRALAIIREAFGQVARSFDTLEEGVVKVPNLGSFRVRHAEKDAEGEKLSVKRILFRPVKPAVERAGSGKTGTSR